MREQLAAERQDQDGDDADREDHADGGEAEEDLVHSLLHAGQFERKPQ